MTVTMNDILSASSLIAVLAVVPNDTKSIDPGVPASGAIAESIIVDIISGADNKKNDNLTPLGTLVSFIEITSSLVCSCTYLSLAALISGFYKY
jgi:hypothetical protein